LSNLLQLDQETWPSEMDRSTFIQRRALVFALPIKVIYDSEGGFLRFRWDDMRCAAVANSATCLEQLANDLVGAVGYLESGDPF
jgi:hypothetical protein